MVDARGIIARKNTDPEAIHLRVENPYSQISTGIQPWCGWIVALRTLYSAYERRTATDEIVSHSCSGHKDLLRKATGINYE